MRGRGGGGGGPTNHRHTAQSSSYPAREQLADRRATTRPQSGLEGRGVTGDRGGEEVGGWQGEGGGAVHRAFTERRRQGVTECWMFYALMTARVILMAKTRFDIFSLR